MSLRWRRLDRVPLLLIIRRHELLLEVRGARWFLLREVRVVCSTMGAERLKLALKSALRWTGRGKCQRGKKARGTVRLRLADAENGGPTLPVPLVEVGALRVRATCPQLRQVSATWKRENARARTYGTHNASFTHATPSGSHATDSDASGSRSCVAAAERRKCYEMMVCRNEGWLGRSLASLDWTELWVF